MIKISVRILVLFLILLAVASPAFCISKQELLSAEIRQQEWNVNNAADTFWTGIVIGGISAAVLIPVSFMFENKEGTEMKIVGITTVIMSGISAVVVVWGGLDWLLSSNKMNELKKASVIGMTVTPFINISRQNETVTGLELKLLM